MKKENRNSPLKQRVWFITGASRGLGRAFTKAALEAGDRVIGVARDISPLRGLVSQYGDRLAIRSVDISDREAVFSVVDEALGIFGRLDVVVNNAGQFLMGMVEEVTESQARAHMDVNFYGPLWVCQAIVPHMRKQGSGHILQLSTMGAGVGFASVGMYGAGKSALDALSEALAMEVESFGIKVTILQPGGYVTDLFTRGITTTKEHAAYTPLREQLASMWGESTDAAANKAAPAVLKVVAMEEPPRRLILGGAAFDQVRQIGEARMEEYNRFESLSRTAD